MTCRGSIPASSFNLFRRALRLLKRLGVLILLIDLLTECRRQDTYARLNCDLPADI